jgi:serine/threonine protein kinase
MHRDIKPDNLLIAKPLDDATLLTPELIKVTDFGISLPVEHNAVGGGLAPLVLAGVAVAPA